MISKDDIEHLKNLARVEFGQKETEALVGDLNAILGYVDQLKEADVSTVSEMTYALEGVTNVMREDIVVVKVNEEHELEEARAVIEAFPEKQGTYLKVKAIL